MGVPDLHRTVEGTIREDADHQIAAAEQIASNVIDVETKLEEIRVLLATLVDLTNERNELDRASAAFFQQLAPPADATEAVTATTGFEDYRDGRRDGTYEVLAWGEQAGDGAGANAWRDATLAETQQIVQMIQDRRRGR